MRAYLYIFHPLCFLPRKKEKTVIREARYQARLINTIKERLPGCIVLKNDSGYLPGVPDLLILYNERWAALEVKTRANSDYQPNQEHYVSKMNEMSFANAIYPENEAEVLDDLQRTLRAGGATRFPQS